MADTRSLIEKLRAMAERGTPHEAAVAREKLLALAGASGTPPRRPAAPAGAPAPEPGGDSDGGWFEAGMRNWRMRHAAATAAWTTSSSTTTSNWFDVNIEVGGRT